MAIADDMQSLVRRLIEPLRAHFAAAPVAVDFTPTLAGTGTAGSFTYNTSNTKARAMRSGPLVHVWGRVTVTGISVSPTGSLTIAGLPFAARPVANLEYASGFGRIGNYNYQTGLQLTSYVEGSRIVLLEAVDNAAINANTSAGVTASLDLSFWAMYETA